MNRLAILRDLGLDFTSVGNHEFDDGTPELRRKQGGGCNPADAQACAFSYSDPTSSQAVGSWVGLGRADTSDNVSQPYATASQTSGYLAANVVVNASGNPLVPAWGIKTFPNGANLVSSVRCSGHTEPGYAHWSLFGALR